MTVNVLAFGIAKEVLGGGSVALKSADGLTAGALKAELEEQYPALVKLTSLVIAVNGEYAAPNVIIKPGDEVAIIPPVSGG